MKADGFGRYDKSDIRLVVCGCGVGLREGEEERLGLAFFGSFVVWFELPLALDAACDSASFAASSNLSIWYLSRDS